MKSAREKMDRIAACVDLSSYRGAAANCGVTPKTVKRAVERANRAEAPERARRPQNTEPVADLVTERVRKTQGRVSAKRLVPAAVASGYTGSARNLRRLMASAKADWRAHHHRGRQIAEDC